MNKIIKYFPISSRIKFNIITFLLLLILTFNGCLNYYQEVKLYPDGSGTMHVDYWMIVGNNFGEDVAEDLGIFNPDSIRSQFQSRYTTIENVEVFTDTTDSTTHAIIDFSFSHIDSLNNTKVFSETKFAFKE